jgi:hypothetical protein
MNRQQRRAAQRQATVSQNRTTRGLNYNAPSKSWPQKTNSTTT